MAKEKDTIELKASLKIIENALKVNPEVLEAFNTYNRELAKVLKGLELPNSQIYKALENASISNKTYYSEIKRIRLDFFEESKIFDTNEKLVKAFEQALNFNDIVNYKIPEISYTKELENLRNSFLHTNYLQGLSEFHESLDENIIESQNLAFIKINKNMQRAMADMMPSGIPTIINKMHKKTAYKLMNVNAINYSKDTKLFFIAKNSNITASISDLNSIISGLDYLSNITLEEMMDFLDYLFKNRQQGMRHNVGKKIFEAIENWTPLISFDKDRYFHGRPLEENECPRPDGQMGIAPQGLAGHGRFNLPAESHFYFSDKEKGAINETKKHYGYGKKTQLTILKPVKSIKLIDLSETSKESHFLRFCRYDLSEDDTNIIKRAYLVPCFVASCCRVSNIDGIKYYGSQEYCNYVTWSDKHFSIVNRQIYD